MKKISLIILCCVFIAVISIPGLASSYIPDGTEKMSEKAEPVGCAVELFIKENAENFSTKTATASQNFSCGGEVIAEIAITGSFCYDGNIVEVTSKSISKSVTYDGWTFQKSSFISSGGSIVLTGTLTKSGKTVNVHITLSCDPDGKIY